MYWLKASKLEPLELAPSTIYFSFVFSSETWWIFTSLFEKMTMLKSTLQSITKIIKTRYIFMKKSQKSVRLAQIPRITPSFGSILCQVWESYARKRWPGMTKQTCNQHWIRERVVQVSLFLWLIVSFEKGFLKTQKPDTFFEKVTYR